MIWFYILIFILSCLVLARSSTWMIQSLIKIARFLQWKEFVAASLLTAFATSLPELFVGIFAALHNQPHLSFANVIGANIIVLTLVTGIAVLMAERLRFQGTTLRKCSFYAPLIAFLPLVLVLDHKMSRPDGGILFLIGLVYFHWLVSQKNGFGQALYAKFRERKPGLWTFCKNLMIFGVATGLLIVSSEGLVQSAVNLAKLFNIPILIIGLFLVALGTTIPELAFSIKSATLNHKAMILGSTMGTIVVNSSLILGMVALICPFEIADFSPYLTGILFTVITALFFTFFAKTDREITKKEGLFLLLIYIAFLIFEILLGRLG